MTRSGLKGSARHDRAFPLVAADRCPVPDGTAHYGESLVNGAFVLSLFGDVLPEMAIALDKDEGALAGYRDVQFRTPAYSGDVLEWRSGLYDEEGRVAPIALQAQAVCRCVGSGSAGRCRACRRRAGQPGGHPARRAPVQRPGDGGGVPGRDLGADKISGRSTTPCQVASYLVHVLARAEGAA